MQVHKDRPQIFSISKKPVGGEKVGVGKDVARFCFYSMNKCVKRCGLTRITKSKDVATGPKCLYCCMRVRSRGLVLSTARRRPPDHYFGLTTPTHNSMHICNLLFLMRNRYY